MSVFEPHWRPTPADQLAALNAALTAEVLRHAETRQRLRNALTLCWVKERLEPVEIVTQVPVLVRRTVPVVKTRESRAKTPRQRADSRHWKPGETRQRSGARFPLAVSARTGLAAVIQQPLALRSGIELDPATISARSGDRVAVFPDSSWLVLSEMVRQRGKFVTRTELEIAVFDGAGSGAVRSAVYRARMVLESVGTSADLEPSRVGQSGAWRLLLAEGA